MQHFSTSPPLDQLSEDDRFDRLRLLRSRRVGVQTFKRLITDHGSAKAALVALPDVAAQAGVNRYQICPEGVIHAELKAGKRAGATLICQSSSAYPDHLRNIHDAPPLIWALGELDLLKRPMIALVGARNASSLGTRMAKKLAEDLGTAGFIVVSGLARGIDAAAHSAALQSGTVAVQAGGVDVIYPAENANLAHQIAEKGLRLSETAMGLQPQARHFPARNRIISGLAQAVVIVEAAAKSGSLITARNALDQSRDVFAVPGHPFDARASGCNILIRDGATLVRSAADVIEALAPLPDEAPELPLEPPQETSPLKDANVLHNDILNRLGPSPIAEDQLVRDIGAPVQAIAPVLLDLELRGAIHRQAGGLLSLPS